MGIRGRQVGPTAPILRNSGVSRPDLSTEQERPTKRSKGRSAWMSRPLVAGALWVMVEPLIPLEPPKPRGVRPRADDHVALVGVVFVLRSGIPWRCSRPIRVEKWPTRARRQSGSRPGRRTS